MRPWKVGGLSNSCRPIICCATIGILVNASSEVTFLILSLKAINCSIEASSGSIGIFSNCSLEVDAIGTNVVWGDGLIPPLYGVGGVGFTTPLYVVWGN